MSGYPSEDPGWGGPGGILLGMVLPGLATRRAAKAPNALVTIRQVFLSFTFALVAFLVVLVFVVEEVDDPLMSPGAAAGLVLVVGFALVLLSWQLGRDLPCDEAALVGSYRTRFFLRTALAESAALIGFVLVFLVGSLLPYLAGLVPAAVGFARNAPTRANLERDDEALRDRGCPHSLYALLCQAQLGSR